MRVLKILVIVTFYLILLTGKVYAEELPDPTRPMTFVNNPEISITSNSSESNLELQSILISPNKQLAIINNQIIKLGEQIGENKLIKIEADSVILQRGDQQEVIKLLPNFNPAKN